MTATCFLKFCGFASCLWSYWHNELQMVLVYAWAGLLGMLSICPYIESRMCAANSSEFRHTKAPEGAQSSHPTHLQCSYACCLCASRPNWQCLNMLVRGGLLQGPVASTFCALEVKSSLLFLRWPSWCKVAAVLFLQIFASFKSKPKPKPLSSITAWIIHHAVLHTRKQMVVFVNTSCMCASGCIVDQQHIASPQHCTSSALSTAGLLWLLLPSYRHKKVSLGAQMANSKASRDMQTQALMQTSTHCHADR